MSQFTPQFEQWWNDVGTKVCRFKSDWQRSEAKIVASVAFADGKNARREESKAVTDKQNDKTLLPGDILKYSEAKKNG